MTAEMFEPSNGLVISYNHLSARECDRHEESGRKSRPACVQIIVAGGKSGTVVALFPITSQPPQAGRTALEIACATGRSAVQSASRTAVMHA
jgi:hypothetical protein